MLLTKLVASFKRQKNCNTSKFRKHLLNVYVALQQIENEQAQAKTKAIRVSNVYSDDRYNRTRLHGTYKLPEVGGDFCR